MSKHSSHNTLKVANRLAFQDVVVPSRVEKAYAVRIEKGRLVVEAASKAKEK